MSVLGLAVVLVVSQNGADAAAGNPAVELSAADKAAAAAERAAAAAEKTAAAVERMASVLAPVEEQKADEKKPDGWTGTVGAGLTFITGNTQTLTLTATAAADRKWDHWAMGVRLSGAYGLANPSANVAASVTQTTARRATGTLRGDRTFGGFASIFVLVGSEFDHVKSIESRTFGELGTGLTFFNLKQGDTERLLLRLDLALRAGYETRFQYFPVEAGVDPYGIILLAPRAAVTFRWAVNKHLRLTEELELMPFLLEPTAGRLLVNSATRLNAKLTESVSLVTSLLVNYDSKPPPSTTRRFSTDVALTVGVEAAF